MRVPALVSACLLLFALAAAANPALPSREKAKMAAAMSSYGYYPAYLPAGLAFAGWKTNQLTPMVCGQNLSITFAGSGKRIEWASSRDCGDNGAPACHNDGYPGYGFMMTATQSARINGRRVYFSPGNHGSNAWACIPVTVGGYADIAVVGIWENFMTARDAMKLVASAKPLSR